MGLDCGRKRWEGGGRLRLVLLFLDEEETKKKFVCFITIYRFQEKVYYSYIKLHVFFTIKKI